MKWPAILVTGMLLAGCRPTIEDRRAEALAAEPRITPGVYSNLAIDPAGNDLTGMEIALDAGSASTVAILARCTTTCTTATYAGVRRGLGGISFTAEGGVLVSVQPAGRDAVMLGADWGDGFTERRLAMVAPPAGVGMVIRRP